MVSRQIDSPRIFDQKSQLQPNGPLSCVNGALTLISKRYDPGACLGLHIMIDPFVACELVKTELEGAVGSHGCGVCEDNLAHVESYVTVFIDVVCDFFGS